MSIIRTKVGNGRGLERLRAICWHWRGDPVEISMAIYVRGTYRQNTTILLANYCKVYNNMFRPYSWAIIRLYHEPRVGYITCYLLDVLESSP